MIARHAGVAVCVLLPFAMISATADGGTFTRTVESREGLYRALITVEAQAERYPELNRWQAIVSRADGGELYRLERPVPYDTPFPALALSDSAGAGLVLNAFDGIVEFIDGRGSVIRRWRPFASETPSHERILTCSIAGARVAVAASEPTAGPALVHAMRIDGVAESVMELGEEQAGAVFLSGDGELIVAGGSTPDEPITVSTAVFGWDGALRARAPVEMRLADVMPGVPAVIVGDARTVHRIDLRTGASRTVWSVERPDAVLSDLMSVDEGVAIVSQEVIYRGGPPVYGGTRLVLVAPDGVTLMDRTLEGTASVPARASVDNGEIRVTLDETTRSISVPR